MFGFVERFAGCFALEILIAAALVGWGLTVDFQIFTMHILSVAPHCPALRPRNVSLR